MCVYYTAFLPYICSTLLRKIYTRMFTKENSCTEDICWPVGQWEYLFTHYPWYRTELKFRKIVELP